MEALPSLRCSEAAGGGGGAVVAHRLGCAVDGRSTGTAGAASQPVCFNSAMCVSDAQAHKRSLVEERRTRTHSRTHKQRTGHGHAHLHTKQAVHFGCRWLESSVCVCVFRRRRRLLLFHSASGKPERRRFNPRKLLHYLYGSSQLAYESTLSPTRNASIYI